MTKDEALLVQFAKTLAALKEVLDKLPEAGENHAIFRDSAVQRFEIAYDSCWKTLKEQLLVRYGVSVASPKKAFQEASKQGIITDDAAWLDFTNLRNEIMQVYNEDLAEKALGILPLAHKRMNDLHRSLEDNQQGC